MILENETLKLFTGYSGIGSPEQALKKLKIKFRVICAVEIDEFARETYLANHETERMEFDMGDIDFSKFERADLAVFGFPCQPFSIAGKGKGFQDVRGTQFFNVARFIKENQPKSFILENVKGLVSNDNGRTFQTILDLLSNCGGTVNGQLIMDFFDDGLGYHIYFKVLNTKDFGLPQNRERIFIVGFKDYKNFRFPIKEELKLKLRDLLEEEVDEKYFLSEAAIKSIILNENNLQPSKVNPDIANTLQSPGNACGTYKGMTAVKINKGVILNNKYKYFKEIKDSLKNEICTTIDASYYKGFGVRSGKCRQVIESNQSIRRLTPLECFRLQGYPDDFKKVVSDTQLYKQTGNTISIPPIEKIIINILKP